MEGLPGALARFIVPSIWCSHAWTWSRMNPNPHLFLFLRDCVPPLPPPHCPHGLTRCPIELLALTYMGSSQGPVLGPRTRQKAWQMNCSH